MSCKHTIAWVIILLLIIYANDRDHLDSLGKLRRPSVKSDSSLSWTSSNPKATLQAWAPLDNKVGKLPPTTGRPSSATTLPAENDTGKEDGELPSTGATDMDVTMKSEVDGGAEGVTAADGEPSPEGSSKPVDEAGAAADEGEIRQQDVEMGEANGEDQIVLPSPGSRTFRAVLRKENGTSGKRVELEAQVTHLLCM